MLIRSPDELALLSKTRRKETKLNQTKVSEKVGLKQDTVSAFENKPASTKLDTLFRILSALELEIHILPKEKPQDNRTWTEEW